MCVYSWLEAVIDGTHVLSKIYWSHIVGREWLLC